jgi:hypothetical protein
VHSKGLSFRGVQVDKILFTGHNRLRISCAGVRDLFESDSQIPLGELQVGRRGRLNNPTGGYWCHAPPPPLPVNCRGSHIRSVGAQSRMCVLRVCCVRVHCVRSAIRHHGLRPSDAAAGYTKHPGSPKQFVPSPARCSPAFLFCLPVLLSCSSLLFCSPIPLPCSPFLFCSLLCFHVAIVGLVPLCMYAPRGAGAHSAL